MAKCNKKICRFFMVNPKKIIGGDKKLGKTEYPLKRIVAKTCINLSESKWFPSKFRIRLLRWSGVKIGNQTFIGSNVMFDGIRPDLVNIGNHVKITAGTKIITHFFNPNNNGMYLGRVFIEDNVFIGMNTLIVNPIKIGTGAVLAAGSVVTKDIPEWEIWGGNPAKFLKKRNHD